MDRHLKALRPGGREARVVADDTRHPHVHKIANRVDPQIGKAAKLGNSRGLYAWLDAGSGSR